MLPGHLQTVNDFVQAFSSGDSRQLYAAEICRAPHYSLNHVRRHVLASRIGWEIVKQNRDLMSFVS